MTATTPNPLSLAKRVKQHVAVIDPTLPTGRVTLGDRTERIQELHDGVVKTKQLKPGMTVQPFVKGQARGAERVVESVERLDDGALWRVSFTTPHPTWEFKAAYRWFVPELAGTTVTTTVRRHGFVPYQEA